MGFRFLTRLFLLVLFSFLSEGVWGRNVDLMGRQGITVSGSALSPSSSGNTGVPPPPDPMLTYPTPPGTSTSSAATVTPSPVITLNTINQLTTCTSTSISWFYNGPETPMSLTVANINVTPSSSSSRSGSPTTSTVSTGAQVPTNITVEIASALDPTSLDFTWPSVNVPQGWYAMYAGIPAYGIVESSTAFFVSTGSDTSCLVASASTSASHSLSPSLTATTALPVSASSSSSINKGAIIGIVLGSLGLCLALVIAYCCCRRKGGRRIKGTKGGRWAGLKSTDSHTGLQAGRTSRSQPHPSQEDSLGPDAPMGSDEGPSEEKLSTSPAKYAGNGSPYDYETGLSLATLPTLQHSQGLEPTGGGRVSRSYSQASSHGGHSVNAMEFGAPPIAYLQNRRPSTTESQKPMFDSPSYPPPTSTGGSYPSQLNRSTSTRSATQPSTPNHHHQQQQQEPPQSPVATPETKKANRGSMKRKPVPAYEDHELSSSSSPTASPSALAVAAFPDLRSNGSDASLRAPAAVFPDLRTNGSNASLRGLGGGSSNGGHYSTTRARTRSRPGSAHSLAVQAVQEQELARKSSFGPGGVEGKPLHYLIPDMPMKQ